MNKKRIIITILSIFIVFGCMYVSKVIINYSEEKVYVSNEVINDYVTEGDNNAVINRSSDDGMITDKNKISKNDAIIKAESILKNGLDINFNEEEVRLDVVLTEEDLGRYKWDMVWNFNNIRRRMSVSIDSITGEVLDIIGGYDISINEVEEHITNEETYKIIEPLMREMDINIEDYYIDDKRKEKAPGSKIFTNKNDENKAFIISIDPNSKKIREYYNMVNRGVKNE